MCAEELPMCPELPLDCMGVKGGKAGEPCSSQHPFNFHRAFTPRHRPLAYEPPRTPGYSDTFGCLEYHWCEVSQT